MKSRDFWRLFVWLLTDWSLWADVPATVGTVFILFAFGVFFGGPVWYRLTVGIVFVLASGSLRAAATCREAIRNGVDSKRIDMLWRHRFGNKEDHHVDTDQQA